MSVRSWDGNHNSVLCMIGNNYKFGANSLPTAACFFPCTPALCFLLYVYAHINFGLLGQFHWYSPWHSNLRCYLRLVEEGKETTLHLLIMPLIIATGSVTLHSSVKIYSFSGFRFMLLALATSDFC